jgi:hypothetical protein
VRLGDGETVILGVRDGVKDDVRVKVGVFEGRLVGEGWLGLSVGVFVGDSVTVGVIVGRDEITVSTKIEILLITVLLDCSS